jgi:hypothetical protein
MSKYNLIDIFEQYQIGSGFTRDFDYAGMLNAGLKTGVDTDIEILRKMSDDFEDVNYHRENNHLQKAIDALEEGAIKEASMFFGDFHAEIKSTMETFDMDIEPTLGKFMASKMDENEAVDLAIEASQEKAGIKEVRIEREVASRIEGLMNIQLKKQFLDVFEDLWLDLIEEDPFYAEDVINHLNNEMHKRIDDRQAQGDRLAGMEESDSYVDEIGEGAMQPGEADLEAGVKGNMDAFTEIKEELAPTGIGITQKQLDNLKRLGAISGLEVYVQDKDGSNVRKISYTLTNTNFEKNLDDVDLVDENLKAHFGRFMKDYQ